MTLPLLGWLALILPFAASQGGPPDDRKVETLTLSGTVVGLNAALKEKGLPCDPEPFDKQVVLREPDGSIFPLLSDEASRALFLDERLRNRRTEVRARRRPGLPFLQVLSFQVEEDGRLRTPEYFCEICTISVRYPQICPCCQGEMVLRMRPDAQSQ
jgi:hypothetical protein